MASKRKEPETKTFLVRGTLELAGVTFTVSATSADAARAKASSGEWEDWDTSGAESVNWKLDPDSVEES